MKRVATLLLLAGPAAAAPDAGPPAPLVRAVDAQTFEIDRDAARRLFADPSALRGEVALARPDAEAIKARARGERPPPGPPPTGLVLERVAPGSLPHRLGLRTGDRVEQVDGVPIADGPPLIALGWRMRARLLAPGDWAFDVHLVRDGRARVLRYRVRGPTEPPPDPSSTPPAPAGPTPEPR